MISVYMQRWWRHHSLDIMQKDSRRFPKSPMLAGPGGWPRGPLHSETHYHRYSFARNISDLLFYLRPTSVTIVAYVCHRPVPIMLHSENALYHPSHVPQLNT
ncbi:hypothetical protein CEXT_265571 [Caerostris extrusa]|uniref:Uncharacterized protein n=1 Tax=Caerostris extrusa TaxID=172846 RepID=A0AAV4MZV0_CAEEX|nr:hypothetical protein CEXT_265571 [Caerostris extrusa]